MKRTTEFARLRHERRQLATRLAVVDARLDRLAAERCPGPIGGLERLLDELSAGLDHLRPLPVDFSRADLYRDHD